MDGGLDFSPPLPSSFLREGMSCCADLSLLDDEKVLESQPPTIAVADPDETKRLSERVEPLELCWRVVINDVSESGTTASSD